MRACPRLIQEALRVLCGKVCRTRLVTCPIDSSVAEVRHCTAHTRPSLQRPRHWRCRCGPGGAHDCPPVSTLSLSHASEGALEENRSFAVGRRAYLDLARDIS